MILVTGGLGYIGSHVVLALREAGFAPVVVDDLSNSKRSVLERLARLCGGPVPFEEGSVLDAAFLDTVLARRRFDAVAHFAGRKSVSESVAEPLAYYEANVLGSVRLLQAMQRHGVRHIVFSSSAAVYGAPRAVPVAETAALAPITPYGATKATVERVLRDVARADAGFRFAILRYFNPVGAHPSAMIGEDPSQPPQNLMPLVCRAAAGEGPALSIFGNDYETPDGTCIRDFIHVMDLAQGHVAALRYLADKRRSLTVNLGTGSGCSVLELVRAFEAANGVGVPWAGAPRRTGDPVQLYASAALAVRKMGWRARLDIAQMCRDAWRWHRASRAA
jgi:UDP-glucose 4-epimerase